MQIKQNKQSGGGGAAARALFRPLLLSRPFGLKPTTSSTLPSSGGLAPSLGASGDEPKELQLVIDVEDVAVVEQIRHHVD